MPPIENDPVQSQGAPPPAPATPADSGSSAALQPPQFSPSSQPSSAAPSPAPAAPSTPAAPSLYDRLGQVTGTQFASDDDVVNLFGQVRDFVSQQQQLAAYGQRYIPYASQFEQWMAEQQQAKAPLPPPRIEQEAAPEPYWAPPPPWNPGDEQYLMRDAEGRLISPSDPTLVSKYRARQQWEREASERLLKDPASAIFPGIKPMLKEFIKEQGYLTKSEWEQQQQQQYAQSFVIAHQDWIYQKDPASGQRLVDQLGQPVFTPMGLYFAQAVQNLQARGVTDQNAQIELAMEMTMNRFGGGQPGQPANGNGNGQPPAPPSLTGQPQQPGADPKERFLAGAGHAPNRAGTVNRSAMPNAPQNPNLSYPELLRQRARAAGISME